MDNILKNFLLTSISISFVFHSSLSQASDDDDDFEAYKISFPAATPAVSEHSRVYITRTIGPVHSIDIPKSNKRIAGDIAKAIFVPSLFKPINYPYSTFGKFGGYGHMNFDLYNYKNKEISPILSLNRKVTSNFIDYPLNTSLELLMGVTSFSGYESDFGKTKLELNDNLTTIIIMGQQVAIPDQKMLRQLHESEEKKAEENFDDDYFVPSSTANWGFTITQMQKDDVNFCLSYKGKTIAEDMFEKEVSSYASQFLDVNNKIAFSKRFTLACTAIASSVAVKKVPRKLNNRFEQINEFIPFIDMVTEEEINASPVLFTKQRPFKLLN